MILFYDLNLRHLYTAKPSGTNGCFCLGFKTESCAYAISCTYFLQATMMVAFFILARCEIMVQGRVTGGGSICIFALHVGDSVGEKN